MGTVARSERAGSGTVTRYPLRVSTGAPSLLTNNPSFTLRYAVKRLRFAIPVVGGRPAVTYAAFRSSSTAIHHAIRAAGIGVSVKAHMLAPDHMLARVRERVSFINEEGRLPRSCHVGDWAVRLGIIEARRPADFVIPIRDPWAVAHSCFVLSAADADAAFSREAVARGELPRAELVDRAEKMIFGGFPHDFMFRWLREDAAKALEWNPLEHEFDSERGAGDYRHGPWRIQLLRADLSDASKSEELRRFFGRPSITVVPKNGALSRSNASEEVAAVAREAIARRPESVRALLEDPLAAHFWRRSDRDRMAMRWCRQT